METKDIINQIKNGGVSVEQSSLRTALIFLLRKDGYKSKDIAIALDIHRNSANYHYSRSLDFYDMNDKIFLSSLKELEQHELRLVPYFVTRMGKHCIKTYLTIDNIKL